MLTLAGLLNLVILLVVAGVLFWLVLWFIDWVGVGEPFNKVIKVVLGIFVLLFLFSMLGGVGGLTHPVFFK